MGDTTLVQLVDPGLCERLVNYGPGKAAVFLYGFASSPCWNSYLGSLSGRL